jgi:nucleoside-triphosphatase THEP1
LDTNAIVYEDSTGGSSRTGEKLRLRCSRAHGFLACSIPTDSKSGQFKVRTQESKKNMPIAVPEGSAKENVGHLYVQIPQNRRPQNAQFQTQKPDSLRSAPHFQKTPILAAF